MSQRQVAECFKKDTYIDATDAKKLGVVDHIIMNQQCITKKIKL